MKLYATLFAALLAVPAFAQTEGDATGEATGNSAGADARMEAEMSSRVGPAFYSDTEMTTLRPAAEIQTQWATISPEDQTALRDRCEKLMNQASESEGGDASASGGTDAGASTGGTATDSTTAGATAAEINMFENDAHMRQICEAIKGL